MASALQEAYADLFEIYPDACEKDDKSLKDFFTPTTDAGEQVVVQTVATFKVLCGFADFRAVTKEEKGEEEHKEKAGYEEGKGAQTTAGVTINLNIQLTLPITENEKVYENIFKALKDNLLTRESKTD